MNLFNNICNNINLKILLHNQQFLIIQLKYEIHKTMVFKYTTKTNLHILKDK